MSAQITDRFVVQRSERAALCRLWLTIAPVSLIGVFLAELFVMNFLQSFQMSWGLLANLQAGFRDKRENLRILQEPVAAPGGLEDPVDPIVIRLDPPPLQPGHDVRAAAHRPDADLLREADVGRQDPRVDPVHQPQVPRAQRLDDRGRGVQMGSVPYTKEWCFLTLQASRGV